MSVSWISEDKGAVTEALSDTWVKCFTVCSSIDERYSCFSVFKQVCVPGTSIWLFVTWTRSCSCLRPDTLLSFLHRSKVRFNSFSYCMKTCLSAVTVLYICVKCVHDLRLLLGDNSCQLYQSQAGGIYCVATCPSSYRPCLQLRLQSGSDCIQSDNASSLLCTSFVLFFLTCMRRFRGELETMQPVLIRLSYADCMSGWESIRAVCEHYVLGEYKIRPWVVNGASVNVNVTALWGAARCSIHKENACVNCIYNNYSAFTVARWGQTQKRRCIGWINGTECSLRKDFKKHLDLGAHLSSHTLLWLLQLHKEKK